MDGTVRMGRLVPQDYILIGQVARMLVDGFRDKWPEAYPTVSEALEEVRDSFEDGHLSLIAVDEAGQALGWIAAERQYQGHTWEIQPIIVHPAYQGRGLGRDLVAVLEDAAKSRGATTLWVASDDETNLTTLGGIELYPNPLDHLAAIQDLGGHPFGFYQRVGFTLVGVLPDANGPGKPDIFLAKRLY